MHKQLNRRGVSYSVVLVILAILSVAVFTAIYLTLNSHDTLRTPTQSSVDVCTISIFSSCGTVFTKIETTSVFANSPYGFYGSNAMTIELTSALLNSGYASSASATSACSGANFQLTFNTPGGATYIQSINLSFGGNTLHSTDFVSQGSTCVPAAFDAGGNANVGAGAAQTLVIFIGSTLTAGTTYSYVIACGNGQSVSGSLIAQ